MWVLCCFPSLNLCLHLITEHGWVNSFASVLVVLSVLSLSGFTF